MKNPLFPDLEFDNAYSIPFEKLYEDGIRGVIFDIDNTLVRHGAPADERSADLMERLRQIGLTVCLISNNHEERVRPFAEKVGTAYTYDAAKPLKKGYLAAMKEMGTDAANTVFVGDQIFTDTLGANLTGVRSILVTPIFLDPDPWIRIKRRMERVVLHFYHKKCTHQKTQN